MAKAQENTLRFGYISYKEALKAMPEYNTSLQEIEALKGKYAEELKRVEDEFNVKYEDFLNKQKDFAPSILNCKTLLREMWHLKKSLNVY